jgi:uncharacterized membrane protein HdeD (DUF308 family)
MLVVRGCIAFVAGVWAGNSPGMSADGAVTLLGIWTLAEGAALVRQAYPPTGTTARAQAQPALMALGGLGLAAGALTVVAPSISTSVIIWVLGAWFAVRGAAEVVATPATTPSRARLFLGLSAVVDLVLATVLMTHTTGTATSIVLFGGGLAALWGVLHVGLGLYAGNKIREEAGSPLLAPR